MEVLSQITDKTFPSEPAVHTIVLEILERRDPDDIARGYIDREWVHDLPWEDMLDLGDGTSLRVASYDIRPATVEQCNYIRRETP